MLRKIFSFTFRTVALALMLVGLGAVVMGVLLAAPLHRPPTLESISRTARAVDRSDMPDVNRFQARDGTTLGYRHYPARQPGERVAIVVHGSSASSIAVHALAKALAAAGVETFTPDIRGHGVSGTRGDIGYYGQLEDDMADLVGEIRKTRPEAPLTLLGHSSGGAFALRVAASPIQALFERTILIAPFLGPFAATSHLDGGGWARADVPRYLALAVLDRLGFHGADAMPALAFAVSANSKMVLTDTYSFRLMRNFATNDYARDLAAATRPIAVYAGAADELMISDQYQAVVGPRVPVHLIEGVNHMAVVSAPAAVAAIADDVAKFAAPR
ncbi:MAG: alpha/beta hydrolase [Xanthobacteraceae bacterium]|nr:alpha/beta hydrolase [Xanthobacteraceae bacterium]